MKGAQLPLLLPHRKELALIETSKAEIWVQTHTPLAPTPPWLACEGPESRGRALHAEKHFGHADGACVMCADVCLGAPMNKLLRRSAGSFPNLPPADAETWYAFADLICGPNRSGGAIAPRLDSAE